MNTVTLSAATQLVANAGWLLCPDCGDWTRIKEEAMGFCTSCWDEIAERILFDRRYPEAEVEEDNLPF